MPHYILVEDQYGRLREKGVAAPQEPRSAVGTDQKVPGDLKGISTTQNSVEEVFEVSDKEDLPPQQPKDELAPEGLACPHCGKPCSSKAGLHAHIWAKHSEEE